MKNNARGSQGHNERAAYTVGAGLVAIHVSVLRDIKESKQKESQIVIPFDYLDLYDLYEPSVRGPNRKYIKFSHNNKKPLWKFYFSLFGLFI